MRAARRKRTGDAYSGNLARLGEEAEGLRSEQLLIAALHAQNIAVEALSDLREFTWWSERDVLTQIPNRALTLDRLENAIAMARRHDTRIAVLFIDLDHSRKINDDWGYEVGDAALQLVARRLLLLV